MHRARPSVSSLASTSRKSGGVGGENISPGKLLNAHIFSQSLSFNEVWYEIMENASLKYLLGDCEVQVRLKAFILLFHISNPI